MTTHTIKSASKANQEQAFSVILLSFALDPLSRFVYPDPQLYVRYFPEVVRMMTGNAIEHGTGYYADEFSGVALWLPPNVHPQEEEMLALLQKTVPRQNQEDVFAVLETMGDHHPAEPHWYLPMIGVDPMKQGKGYGSALMQHAVARCDREKQLAYLETANPRNVPLYQRHGFETLTTIQVGSSPRVFPMLRRPGAR